jgi:hypothetical protein
MRAICVIGLIILMFSCKKETAEDPLQLVSKGSIVASFNGKNWPDLTQNGAAVQITYYKGRGYCPPENQMVVRVSVKFQPKEGYRLYEEAGIRLHQPIIGTKIVVSPDSDGSGIECTRLAQGDAIGGFSYTGFDGYDLVRFATYSVRENRINQLVISRLDTVAKVVEGSFEVNFIRQGSGTSTYPDTIQIKCSKFVAPITN